MEIWRLATCGHGLYRSIVQNNVMIGTVSATDSITETCSYAFTYFLLFYLPVHILVHFGRPPFLCGPLSIYILMLGSNFSNRVINAWNSLFNDVVKSPSVCMFKKRLHNVNLGRFLTITYLLTVSCSILVFVTVFNLIVFHLRIWWGLSEDCILA